MNESLRRIVANAANKLDYPETDFLIERPKQPEHGNFSSNIALTLTKELKRNPMDIAEDLVEALEYDSDVISQVMVAPPGFINFYLTKDYFRDQLSVIYEQDDEYGKKASNGQSALIEFVSANPTGPLTIGHGRQAVLGDTIANFLEWNGYEVSREYYYNNAGRQMRVLAESVKSHYFDLVGEEFPFPEDGYQGEYIKDIAQSLVDEYDDTLVEKDDLGVFQEAAENAVFDDINSTLERLGIKFDNYYNEQSLYDDGTIDTVLKEFKERGYSYEEDGAVWFKATEFDQEQDRVIVKSTGEPTYRLPDMAYHTTKIDRGFARIIDLFGADHHAAYPDVLAGLQALGYETDSIEVHLHQFVTLLREGKKVKMSTRKANYVTLDELLDEVGVDVVRYFFNMRTMNSHLNFDLDLALKQSDENPVFYLQYAHARICSIFDKAKERGVEKTTYPDLSLLGEEPEINLMEKMLEFPDVVDVCEHHLEPLNMCNYLQELATALHKFYTEHWVITDNLPMTQARLYLIDTARIVLSNGLKILGITAPDKM
ncbi:MAG: arginine--tRNA ligase [Candidatus Marinimicrobia bacterium]|nr:arginine--tRNA ligase [Candidatus Neomarinimicrobiota bacterium]